MLLKALKGVVYWLLLSAFDWDYAEEFEGEVNVESGELMLRQLCCLAYSFLCVFLSFLYLS